MAPLALHGQKEREGDKKQRVAGAIVVVSSRSRYMKGKQVSHQINAHICLIGSAATA